MIKEVQTISIDGVEYVRKDKIKERIVQVDSENKVASTLVGNFVIVRSRNEGINAGTVIASDDTGIILGNCRRLYYHRPVDNSLSWYEGIAVSGLSDSSKVSGTVERKVIIEDYSATICTKEAEISIMEKTPNEQN